MIIIVPIGAAGLAADLQAMDSARRNYMLISVTQAGAGAAESETALDAAVFKGSNLANRAPVHSSLKATQPQSIITATFIEQAVTPLADFNAAGPQLDDIAERRLLSSGARPRNGPCAATAPPAHTTPGRSR